MLMGSKLLRVVGQLFADCYLLSSDVTTSNTTRCEVCSISSIILSQMMLKLIVLFCLIL